MFTIWPRGSCAVRDLKYLCRHNARCIWCSCLFQSRPVSSRLVAAKTRVALLVATSIPRLELMAAILGLRLTAKFPEFTVVHWVKQSSGPMNVVRWVKGRSQRFKPFVVNYGFQNSTFEFCLTVFLAFNVVVLQFVLTCTSAIRHSSFQFLYSNCRFVIVCFTSFRDTPERYSYSRISQTNAP